MPCIILLEGEKPLATELMIAFRALGCTVKCAATLFDALLLLLEPEADELVILGALADARLTPFALFEVVRRVAQARPIALVAEDATCPPGVQLLTVVQRGLVRPEKFARQVVRAFKKTQPANGPSSARDIRASELKLIRDEAKKASSIRELAKNGFAKSTLANKMKKYGILLGKLGE